MLAEGTKIDNKPFKVLIIDDSRFIRSQLADVLRGISCTVIEAEDGEDGWEKIQSNRDLSLVFCDVNMPRLDGLELLKRLSANLGKYFFPIVMLTTESSMEKMLAGKVHGATAWLIKPPSAENIRTLVIKVMASRT